MKIKIAILGLGGRGRLYADITQERLQDIAELTAICDILPDKRKLAKDKYGLPDTRIFADYKEMLAHKKIADVIIISTQDADHYTHAIAALNSSYDILLEKPISPSENECVEIAQKAAQMGRKVAVAHVLRYTPFYQQVKDVIDSGIIGKVMTISQTENVNYLHQAHSYVRGNWRNSNKSAPMILAKSCHDMDIIKWLTNSACSSVTSFGSLSYYKSENAPVGSADRCLDCKLANECVYNAVKFYNDSPYMFGLFNKGNPDVNAVLKDSPYGRCVWKCDNNVVDHQVVNLLFESGATAQFTMTAFSAEGHRTIKIHGTEGEIEGDIETDKFIIKVYGKPSLTKEVIITREDSLPGEHTGGDVRLLKDFIEYVSGSAAAKALTSIDESIESHRMCFLAERSRLNGGAALKL